MAYALKLRKNVIPVLLSGVNGFPTNLPEDVADVATKNGPEYNKYYFDEFYRRLKSFLHCVPRNAKVEDKDYATITLYSDSDALVYSDGEHIANVKANEFTKVQVPLGEHVLEYVSIRDSSRRYSEVQALNEVKNYVIKIELDKKKLPKKDIKEESTWYSRIFRSEFHPIVKFIMALQIMFYGIAFFNFVWTLLWGCLAFYNDFQISLFLLCGSLFLSLLSSIRLHSCKMFWWALICLFDFVWTFYLCVVAKYLFTNWSSFSTLQIPSSMRYRLLYFLGERMGDSYFTHPYLLLFAILHTVIVCIALCLKYNGKMGWQLFK